MARSVLDLPAPLAPSSAATVRARHAESDAMHDGPGAIAHRQALDLQQIRKPLHSSSSPR